MKIIETTGVEAGSFIRFAEGIVGCRSFGVGTILVGLHRVGIVGFKDALKQIDESGLTDREAIVDHLIETLAADNYIPDPQLEAFRTAIWREYLRHKGEDFSEFFSAVDVTVRGDHDDERDRFVKMLRSVLGDFELTPTIRFAPPGQAGPNPQLVIDDEIIIRGPQSRHDFKTAIRKSISDW